MAGGGAACRDATSLACAFRAWRGALCRVRRRASCFARFPPCGASCRFVWCRRRQRGGWRSDGRAFTDARSIVVNAPRLPGCFCRCSSRQPLRSQGRQPVTTMQHALYFRDRRLLGRRGLGDADRGRCPFSTAPARILGGRGRPVRTRPRSRQSCPSRSRWSSGPSSACWSMGAGRSRLLAYASIFLCLPCPFGFARHHRLSVLFVEPDRPPGRALDGPLNRSIPLVMAMGIGASLPGRSCPSAIYDGTHSYMASLPDGRHGASADRG